MQESVSKKFALLVRQVKTENWQIAFSFSKTIKTKIHFPIAIMCKRKSNGFEEQIATTKMT